MKVFFMFISQYTMDITPDIRGNVDYVFALHENIIMNRERLYRNFFGVVPTFEAFCEILDQCTQNYECLVVDHTSESNKIEDVIFWYKATPREHRTIADSTTAIPLPTAPTPREHIGSPAFWKYGTPNYDPKKDSGSDSEKDDANQRRRRSNTRVVKEED
eukprot:jgi/Mesvir1/2715/Mv02104-RA.1